MKMHLWSFSSWLFVVCVLLFKKKNIQLSIFHPITLKQMIQVYKSHQQAKECVIGRKTCHSFDRAKHAPFDNGDLEAVKICTPSLFNPNVFILILNPHPSLRHVMQKKVYQPQLTNLLKQQWCIFQPGKFRGYQVLQPLSFFLPAREGVIFILY